MESHNVIDRAQVVINDLKEEVTRKTHQNAELRAEIHRLNQQLSVRTSEKEHAEARASYYQDQVEEAKKKVLAFLEELDSTI